MVDSDHPLWAWLQSHGETVDEFCLRVGTFGRWWTYRLIRGLVRHPRPQFLSDIQTATGGDVSIEECINYIKTHPRPSKEPVDA